MKARALVGRSLVYYARSHAGVLAAAAIAAAALVGALLVGNSVDYTLRRFARLRLGGIAFAVETGSRFFRDDLAARVGARGDAPASAALALPGMALAGAEERDDRQINRVRIIGVAPEFWDFADDPVAAAGAARAAALQAGEVALNRRLAQELNAAAGDEISLRVLRPGALPREAPLAARGDETAVRLRARVVAVLDDEDLGRFDLAAGQAAPRNAFVARSWLQERLGQAGRANLLLVGGDGGAAARDALRDALRAVWRAEDSGVRIETPLPGVRQIVADRVFLDGPVAEAALALPDGVGALTYLVNEIANADAPERSTPYSFVNALAPASSANSALSSAPPDLRDDEILLNEWTAERLRVAPGGRVRLAYSVPLANNRFEERERLFAVRAVLPMAALETERALMPAFPGLSDVESCAQWDVGLPMDEDRLKDPDNEAYWNTYRDTPKAIVTLSAGQEMWGSRFGSLTAVRVPAARHSAADVERELTERLIAAGAAPEPAPVRRLAEAAVAQARDLGELFLGMSFFLVVSALMLTSLLFALAVDGRAPQSGLLRAVGLGQGRLVRLYAAEAFVVAGLGCALGAALGLIYTRGLLWALARHWQASVAGAQIRFHAEPATIFAGASAAFGLAALSATLSAWRHARATARDLLQGVVGANALPSRRSRGRVLGLTALILLGGAGALAVGARAEAAPPAFFGAGAAVLAAGLLGAAAWARRRASSPPARLTFRSLVLDGVARRAGHGLMVVGLLAGGSFLALSVSAMRDDPAARARRRDSGAGGFALFADSTAPVLFDLNAPADRARLGLPVGPPEWHAVALRVREGEDAGCLNLNRAQRPRVIGVDPAVFARLGAFVTDGGPDPWAALAEAERANSHVPALAGDTDTAQWGLGLPVGQGPRSELEIADEQGRPARLRLVASLPMRLSLFQGSVLISETDFVRLYPSEEGYRLFLVDAPPGAAPALREALERALARQGLEAADAAERLREFHAVEETYLRIFLALGGLGLLLGSAGMAAVAHRQVAERRPELALLQAVGFSRRRILRLVAGEHAILVLAGLALGAAASAVALVPALRSTQPAPWPAMLGLLAGMALVGIGSAALATARAMRAPLVPALRRE